MNEPNIVIRLEGNGRIYRPGERLVGEYRLEGIEQRELRAVEVSVLWFTEGKGEEDLAVHEFWRHESDGDQASAPPRPARFETILPPSPLSYDGWIVKIRWCVRVRVFLRGGRELVEQKIFRLGTIPSVKLPTIELPTLRREELSVFGF
jgi:hypothetical protein